MKKITSFQLYVGRSTPFKFPHSLPTRVNTTKPGLPDGFFSDQTPQFDHIMEDLRMETVVIYFRHL
jgi:hypothetical protein